MGLRTEKRRRRENKTDYKLRKGLLESKLPRIVIRVTNKYFIVQIVESLEGQDKVIQGVTSRDLLSKGWDKKYIGSLKSIPVGYLSGLLLANKIKNKNQEYLVDLGMIRTISGNRAFSVVKGLIDGGVKINAKDSIFPKKEILNGEHLKPEVRKLISEVKKKL